MEREPCRGFASSLLTPRSAFLELSTIFHAFNLAVYTLDVRDRASLDLFIAVALSIARCPASRLLPSPPPVSSAALHPRRDVFVATASTLSRSSVHLCASISSIHSPTPTHPTPISPIYSLPLPVPARASPNTATHTLLPLSPGSRTTAMQYVSICRIGNASSTSRFSFSQPQRRDQQESAPNQNNQLHIVVIGTHLPTPPHHLQRHDSTRADQRPRFPPTPPHHHHPTHSPPHFPLSTNIRSRRCRAPESGTRHRRLPVELLPSRRC